MSDDSLDIDTAQAPDPSVARAGWRLRLLQELSDIGMDLARALQREALAEPRAAEAPAARRGDPAAAFTGLSRAIRLTLTLEGRADEALRALRAGVAVAREVRRAESVRRAAVAAAEAAAEADHQAHASRKAHKERVRTLVFDVAEREIEDQDALCDLDEALNERLEDDGAYADLDSLPLRETVERLCADLELAPDWGRWTGDGWVPPEPFFRFRASQFRRPSRTMIHGEPDPSTPASSPYRLE